MGRRKKNKCKKTEQEMEFAEEETFPEDNENRNEFVREGEDSKEPGRLNPVGVIVPAAVLICGLAAAILKGYLPHVEMETILGVIVIAIAGIMLGLRIIKTKSFASPGTGVCIRRNSETHRKNKKYAIME